MLQAFIAHNWTTGGKEWEQRDGQSLEIQVPAGGVAYAPGLCVSFQNGPLGRDAERKEANGCFVETVIAVARQRLEFYQASRFRCPENQVAIDHLNIALGALESRTAGREQRGVEGTHRV